MNERWTEREEGGAVKGAALIDKAFLLINIIGKAPGYVTTQGLMRETGWARPTLYRILQAIVANGFVRFDPVADGYTLGYRFLELAQNVWSGSDLASVASAELRRLRDITGETAYLAVPHDGAMMALGKFEGAHAVRSAAKLGIRKPMHCTSQGKAVLAFMPDHDVRRLLATGMERFTPKTVTDPEQLMSHLAIARQRGYAVEDEEILIGNRCVGAPVLDQFGTPVAAISVAGPVWRLTAERAEQLGPEVAMVARSIGLQLRGHGQMTSERHPMIHAVVKDPAFYGGDPVWDSDRAVLIWTDRLGPIVFETDERHTRPYHHPVERPLCAAALTGGVYQLIQQGQVSSFSGGSFVMQPASRDDPEMTAMAAAPDGTLWIARHDGSGSVVEPMTADATSPRWSAQGRVAAMAWSPSGETLYSIDAERGVVLSLRHGERAPRILARIARGSGEPRGIAVDRLGRVWIGLYDGWSVIRLAEDGEIDHVIALPVPRPTGIAFGGRDGLSLFITTARVGLTRDVLDNAPLSGHLLTLSIEDQ